MRMACSSSTSSVCCPRSTVEGREALAQGCTSSMLSRPLEHQMLVQYVNVLRHPGLPLAIGFLVLALDLRPRLAVPLGRREEMPAQLTQDAAKGVEPRFVGII